jgi:hypothetical protein
MEKYKNIIFVILTCLLFLTLFIQDWFWEKKYDLQTQTTDLTINAKSDSINQLTKVVDSLGWEISTNHIDLGRYEFIIGELEQESCCKRKLETLHPE